MAITYKMVPILWLVLLLVGMHSVECRPSKRDLNNDSIIIDLLEDILATLEKISPKTPRDCSVVASQGPYMSGPYLITPWDQLDSFKAPCDMETDSGGWTVFQRRYDGSVDFYRNWDDYKNGFGDIDGEFWLGLSKLNRLTSSGQRWDLRIEFEDFENNTAYAQYGNFGIGDESTGFRLSLGTYFGTAGNGLGYHAGAPFTTKDRDNDDSGPSNCAVSTKGGWWYKSCYVSNLNGLYIGSPIERTTAMVWKYFTAGKNEALKRSEMKIRPTSAAQ